MSDDPPFVPIRCGPDFTDMREEDCYGRALFAPHRVIEDGEVRVIYPAISLTLGSMRSVDSTHYVPTMRLDAHGYSTSLVFCPSAAEMRHLAQMMIEVADQMEAEATGMLDKTLNRKGS